MSMTTITFRTNKELKESATAVFEKMGMNLSTALNIFMRQTVRTGKYPCSIEAEMLPSKDMTHTYPTGFFDLFGSGKDLGFDEEPEELSFENKEIQL